MDSAQCRVRTGRLRGTSGRASVLLGELVVCLLLASALACAAGSRPGVAFFEDFNRKGDGWTAVENGAKAEWRNAGGWRSSPSLALEVKAVRTKAQWESPAVALEKGAWYGFAVRYRARVETSDTGMFRLAFKGVARTPEQFDEIAGAVNCPRVDMRFPDLGHWQVKRFWFKPEADETVVIFDTWNRYGDQTMWFDDVAIVEAPALAKLETPLDGAIIDDETPTLVWRAPFDATPAAAYTVVLARDEELSKERLELAAAALEVTLDAPLGEGTWFWTAWPTVTKEGDRKAIQLASEVRSLYVRRSTPFVEADTTPPHIYRPRPLSDSTVAPGHVWMSFRMMDEGGSGVDVDSLSMAIDGRGYGSTRPFKQLIGEESVRLGWSADADTVDPPRWLGLPVGVHRVDVTVADKAGNVAHKTWQFGVGEKVPAKTWIDQKGRTIANGLPFFPVVLYLRGQRRPDVQEWVDNGANTLVNSHTFPGSFGAKGLAGVMHEFRNNKDLGEMREKLAKLTGELKDSNAILGYWLNETHDELTAEGFTILKELDPNHFNLYSEGWGFASHGHTSDGYFYNDYAVPSRPITSQLPRQEAAQAARKPGQTTWYINQGYDYAITFHRPTPKSSRVFSRVPGFEWRPHGREMRAMAHLAMIGGDMGMCWWAPLIDLDDDAYEALLDEMREFTWIGPIYWQETPRDKAKATWEGGKPRFLMNRRKKLYFTERETGQARYLMAVNADTVPLAATFTVPGLAEGDAVQVMFENRVLRATGGSFADAFAGPQAHVYRMSKRR